MSESDPDGMALDAVEQRVLGCLLEKERTVPSTYPLTLNALVTAANQTSGRDPVMSVGEGEVLAAVESLKAHGLLRRVHPRSGERREKYRQVADEALRLDDGERTVLTLLLLRGPQTPGELRSRSGRLADFDSLDDVDAALQALAGRSGPLVVELEREPGRRERRWAHLLGDAPAVAAPPAPAPMLAVPASPSHPMNPALDPLRSLIGIWQGTGRGDYPTVEPFEYHETIEFVPLADKPILTYSSKTRGADDGRPLHAESGYLRLLDSARLELVIAQAPGIVESSEGLLTHPGGLGDHGRATLTLDSRTVSVMPSVVAVESVARRYSVDGHRLTYTLDMAASGHPMTPHLQAELRRGA